MLRRRFFDPLYGPLEFSERDKALVMSPEIQRLRYVRMCNINSLLITGASEISRFEHVIGVYRLAQEWTRANDLSGDDAHVVHAAALLHDVQTGPFGHSLEYILADNDVDGEFVHEDVLQAQRRQYLQKINRNVAFSGSPFVSATVLGSLWERVAAAIRGDGPFGPIISGRIDLDNIDNVVRLAYHTGVATRDDAQLCLGLARDMRLDAHGVTVSKQGILLVERWAQIRRELYALLLHDWAEFSAKAMLTTMMEAGVEAGLLGADNWLLTDDGLMNWLMRESVGDSQAIGELGRRLTLGDLYEPIALWRSPNIEAYDAIAKISYKREIEKLAWTSLRVKCIFHVILDKGKSSRSLKLRVRDTDETQIVGHDSSEVLIGVFVSRDGQSRAARQRVLSEIKENLASAGVLVVSELEDPVRLGEVALHDRPNQLGLF